MNTLFFNSILVRFALAIGVILVPVRTLFSEGREEISYTGKYDNYGHPKYPHKHNSIDYFPYSSYRYYYPNSENYKKYYPYSQGYYLYPYPYTSYYYYYW